MNNTIKNTTNWMLGLLAVMAVFTTSCEKEIVYEKTRLFRPVLGSNLESVLNTIEVNLGNIKEATSYSLEISRDTFKLIDYQFEIDTNVFVIDEAVLGEPLFYNTLYQIRAVAHDVDSQYDSRASDLGAVRTQSFPTILNNPRGHDVIDTKAKLTWTLSGAAVTGVKVFSTEDLKLKTALASYDVTSADQVAGEVIIDGLEPDSEYQVAIYSGSTLRGWVKYKTLVAGVDPNAGNVIDLSNNEDPNALSMAMESASDGMTILLKRGITYNFPSQPLDKSITIKGAYGFEPNQAAMFTTNKWDLAAGALIDHLVFDDIEIYGEDIGGDYLFQVNRTGAPTIINELRLENCSVHDFRALLRISNDVFVKDFTISNSVVHDIGDLGVIYTDTDGDDKAAIDNVIFQNSTFYKINTFITTRQNMQSFLIDGCTFNEAAGTGRHVFQFRGLDGKTEVINGLTISNTIWGHGWDLGGNGDVGFRLISKGLGATTINVINSWSTSDFNLRGGSEIEGFPSLNYNSVASDLWRDPYNGNFGFRDQVFEGRFDAGDPRWRVKLGN